MARSPEEIADIVQTCLEAIQSGQGTISSVLASYPDLEEVLRPQLETALWLKERSHQFDPRPGYVSASRKRLEAQIAETRLSPFTRLRWLLVGLLAGLRQKRWALQAAVALLLVVSLVFSTNQVALAARNTIPGDFLYLVKITHENTQLLVSFTALGDARLHTDFARRRLIEIEGLVLEGRYDYIHDTVEAYEVQVDRAFLAIQKVAEKDVAHAQSLAGELYDVLANQTSIILVLSEAVPREFRADLARVMQFSQAKASEIESSQLVVASLFTPTPSPDDTPLPGVLDEDTPIPDLTPTPTLSATATETPTVTGTITATHTATGFGTTTPTATNTLLPGVGPSPTGASPASPTPTRTSPASPTPTDEFLPPPTPTPGPTSTPTNTPLPTSTNTSPPPPPATNTPVPPPAPVCQIVAGDPEFLGDKVLVPIINNNDHAITITFISIDWSQTTPEIQQLERVSMDRNGSEKIIWEGPAETSPTIITSFIGDPIWRLILTGGEQNITFKFKRSVIGTSGYVIEVRFDDGCGVVARK